MTVDGDGRRGGDGGDVAVGQAAAVRGLRVAVVVLGDLGRSPRMQYHALALAGQGATVDLIGYGGHPPDRALAEHPLVRVHLLGAPLRQRVPRWAFVPVALADIVAQAGLLTKTLLDLSSPALDLVLVQNPPAFPTLAVALVVARWRACRLVVDWHNFGADLLALKLGPQNLLVRLARAAERALGRRAHGHLCVSEGMRRALATDWGIASARVLRDRPAKRVARLAPAARQELFDRLQLGVPATGRERRAVIVTSSSWTVDEDFSLLLEAMKICEGATAAAGGAGVPPFLFVLTGDGPLRAIWEHRIAALGLSPARVAVRTIWLGVEDYPRLLASADLGVCLHRSASGVDLPMKIADMFGAGLPVCALDYGPVLAELVRDRENGVLFSTGEALGRQICELFAGFPERTPILDELGRGVERSSTESWADGWRREAWPLFDARGVGSGRPVA
jgi:beta-1,4-mannosyltransferase